MSSFSYGDRGLSTNFTHHLTPPAHPPTLIPPPAPAQSSSRSLPQRLTEKVEGWFGSVEEFSDKVVRGARFVIVDCVGYPYTAFCRQCQVYPYYRATPTLGAPFSTAVVLHHIAQTQGIHAWWRGWYHHVALLVIRPFSEAMIGKLTNPPRSMSDERGSRRLLAYLALRSLAYMATIPLVSLTFLEMVQNTSQKVYTGGVLEVIRERNIFTMDKSNQLPFLYLAGPTVLHGFAVDYVSQLAQRLIHKSIRLPHRTGEHRDALSVAMGRLWTAYLGSLLADTVLYPLETVIIRLYCQGMPVLVDNVQTGLDIAFITTYYRGFVDCLSGIWDSEGPWGFYKGFSSLLLRYAVHGAILLLLWRIVKSVNSSRTSR